MFNWYNNNVYKLIGHTAKSSCLGGCIGVTFISCFSFFFFNFQFQDTQIMLDAFIIIIYYYYFFASSNCKKIKFLA